jgi:hypothetical protein
MTCRAKQCARTRQAWQRTCGRHSTYLTNISSPQGNGSCRKQEPRGFRKYVTLYDMITCLKHGSAHRAPTIVHTPCCADTGRESMDCRREPSRTGFGKSGLLKTWPLAPQNRENTGYAEGTMDAQIPVGVYTQTTPPCGTTDKWERRARNTGRRTLGVGHRKHNIGHAAPEAGYQPLSGWEQRARDAGCGTPGAEYRLRKTRVRNRPRKQWPRRHRTRGNARGKHRPRNRPRKYGARNRPQKHRPGPKPR